jgi:hypothetical protein
LLGSPENPFLVWISIDRYLSGKRIFLLLVADARDSTLICNKVFSSGYQSIAISQELAFDTELGHHWVQRELDESGHEK